MADIKVKLKNAENLILFPQSISDIIGHIKTNESSTTVEAELNKLAAFIIADGDLDTALTKLTELNTKSESSHYGSLVELATFIENFMIDEGVVLDVIDTWEELEKFLQGITESDSLTGLLQLMYDRVNAEKSIVEGSDNIGVKSEDVDTTYKDEHGDDVKTTYTKYTISAEGLATTSDIESIQSAVANAQDAAAAAQSSANEAATSAADALTAADKAQETADTKQDKLTPGENITISEDNVISASNPDLSDLEEAVEAAQADATQALADAATAQSAAEGAQSTADEAAAAAATAEQDAQTALAAAETADSKAEAALAAADTALSAAEEAKAAADAAQSDVDDLKETVESLGDTYLTITDAADTYLTKSDAEETYATQDALSEVSSTLDDVNTVANGAAEQASINATAIEELQATVVTGVYYEEITN